MGEIREESSESEWKWIPSSLDLPDDGTRLAPSALENDSRWLTGPPFLSESENAWPGNSMTTAVLRTLPGVENVDTRAFVISLDNNNILPDQSRFSSWSRLIGTTSKVLKSCDIFRKQCDKRSSSDRIEESELLWFKSIQLASFSKEISFLANSKAVKKIISLQLSLQS